MSPAKASTSKVTASKKEKVFHPQSRKAGQLVRAQLRKSKLAEQSKDRSKKSGSQVTIYNFFYHALPPEGELTLDELHYVVRDIWLTRFDREIEAEKASRRKGRPKSVKEQKLEEQKLQEAETYRTGLEVIDLTHPTNVELFRQWDQQEAAYVQQLRFIRISSTSPDTVVLSKSGHHPLLTMSETKENANAKPQEDTMDTDEAPMLLEPFSRFASTIQTMDGV